MHLLRISQTSSHKAILNLLACPQQMVPEINYVQLQLGVTEENLIRKNIKMGEKIEVMHGLTCLADKSDYCCQCVNLCLADV